jgi:hypothetical protein
VKSNGRKYCHWHRYMYEGELGCKHELGKNNPFMDQQPGDRRIKEQGPGQVSRCGTLCSKYSSKEDSCGGTKVDHECNNLVDCSS